MESRSRRRLAVLAALAASLALVSGPVEPAAAHDDAPSLAPSPRRVREGAVVDTLPVVEVTDSFDRRVRRVRASSQHAITAEEIAARPLYRPGEVLEAVPGLLISQHSGEGKANQYYLRGFNLDHGSDVAIFVAGIPVNMPTHAHGQGYCDLNFLIPELVTGVEYQKGTYAAEEGDFGGAGAAHIAYANHLHAPIAQVGVDADGYRRGLLAASQAIAGGDLLGALEVFHNDGPWARPDDFRKVNALLRWGRGDASRGLRLTAMGYDGRWNSTDQVAARAVREGLITRFGSLDPSDGGASHRYSLSADWQSAAAGRFTGVTAYGVAYRMSLISDFTYFLDDTTDGDQFEQFDERVVVGLRGSHQRALRLGGREVEATVGGQARFDDIDPVGLYHTRARIRLATTREDRVRQLSLAPYAQAAVQWSRWLRSVLGARVDHYRFHVRSDQPLNSGDARSTIVSPKLALTIGPWARTAWFVNAGAGFHSNDARGATITVDPKSLDPVDRVDPLVRSVGAEIGLVSTRMPGLEHRLTLWTLGMDSELLFVGDAGITEASRPSRRTGAEWSVVWRPSSWLRGDADLAYSRARFTDDDPAGDRIPGAVEGVASAGVTVAGRSSWSGALRLRWFGPRPLIEDDHVRSPASTIVNAELARTLGGFARLSLEGFNVLDAKVSDIDYFYTSRLPGEPVAGVDDIHTHPQAPRTLRLRLTLTRPGARLPATGAPLDGHAH